MPKHQTVASAVIILSLPLGNASAVAVKEAKRSQNIQLRGRQLREEVVNNATSSLSARSLDREVSWYVILHTSVSLLTLTKTSPAGMC